MKTQTEIDTADAAADAADEWRREVARCKAITERYKAVAAMADAKFAAECAAKFTVERYEAAEKYDRDTTAKAAKKYAMAGAAEHSGALAAERYEVAVARYEAAAGKDKSM